MELSLQFLNSVQKSYQGVDQRAMTLEKSILIINRFNRHCKTDLDKAREVAKWIEPLELARNTGISRTFAYKLAKSPAILNRAKGETWLALARYYDRLLKGMPDAKAKRKD